MPTASIPDGYELYTHPDGKFATLIGPLYLRQTNGVMRFAYRATEHDCNARGIVHGGRLMTFADQVLGQTCIHTAKSNDLVTVTLNCDLVAAAMPGDLIEGEAEIIRIARTLIFVRGKLFCGDKTLLTANGLWARVQPK